MANLRDGILDEGISDSAGNHLTEAGIFVGLAVIMLVLVIWRVRRRSF